MTSLWQAERMVTCDFPCRKNKCCCGAHITLPSLVFERTDFVFLFPKPIVVKNSPSVIDKYMKYSQCFFFPYAAAKCFKPSYYKTHVETEEQREY